MGGRGDRVGWPGRSSEAILLAMACLSPWAFGATEAWAVLGLDLGVAALALLGLVGGRWTSRRSWRRRAFCGPSLALAGLALLALGQAVPLPEPVLSRLAPGQAAFRATLAPRSPEAVAGDPSPPVRRPAPTLSQDPEASVDAAARLAAAWIVFQAVLALRGGSRPFRRFGLAIAANATLLGLFSIVQLLLWDGKIYGVRESPSPSAGPFVCHSHLAASLNLGLGFAVGYLLATGRKRARTEGRGGLPWAAFAAVVMMAGILASQSRGGFLSMAAALLVVASAQRPRSVRYGLMLAAVPVLALGYLSVSGTMAQTQQRLATLGERSAYTNRMEIWADAIHAWPSSAAFGTGLGAFPAAAARHGRRDTGAYFAHAENEYLECLVEGGVVGLALAGAFVIAVVRLGRRARAGTDGSIDRGLLLAALFGGTALACEGLGDFAPHIPGVGVPLLILSGYAARAGLDAGERRTAGGSDAPGWDPVGAAVGLLALGLGIVVLWHGLARARAEAALVGTDLPIPGSSMPAPDREDLSWSRLERRRIALARALVHRPDWAEGHLRLGRAYVGLYRLAADRWLAEGVPDPDERAALCDPLWLLGVATAGRGEGAIGPGELLEHDPIRRLLVPAARSFLEARRCCPVVALTHAELATLSPLLEGGDTPSDYAGRALALAGADGRVIALAAEVAAMAGDRALAARAWKQALDVDDSRWPEIADAAGATLTPDAILDSVATEGRHALWFADRLYATPSDRATRDRFLRAALERLPGDRGLSAPERLHLEARAWAALDEPRKAREHMEDALRLDPNRLEWRKELVAWLLEWGQAQEAHEHALLGLHLAPARPDAHETVERTARALAEGTGPRRPTIASDRARTD